MNPVEQNMVSRPPKSSAGSCGAKASRGRQRGTAALEAALALPVLVFCFMGALDLGFFANALITTEEATRVAATTLAASQKSWSLPGFSADTVAKDAAWQQLQSMPNCSSESTCPLTVSPQLLAAGPDGLPGVSVAVSYTTVPLLAIPRMMTGKLAISRTVYMPFRK